MTPIAPLSDDLLEGVGEVLGHTTTGLSGTQIGKRLATCHIPDTRPSTKRDRITVALSDEQHRTGSGTCVWAFVLEVMKPGRWSEDREHFEQLRTDLNRKLAFAGKVLGIDGKLSTREAATTLSEAAGRRRRLYDQLVERRAHADIFEYCRDDLLADDHFNVIFEAVKGLAERIRGLTGLDKDGSALVDDTFCGREPRVVFNSMRTETERNEQTGLANIMKGLFSAVRNPQAHTPKLLWHVSELDALDLLGTVSLLHRRLDAAVVRRTADTGD